MIRRDSSRVESIRWRPVAPVTPATACWLKRSDRSARKSLLRRDTSSIVEAAFLRWCDASGRTGAPRGSRELEVVCGADANEGADTLLTAEQAWTYLTCSESTLKRLRQAGEVRPIRISQRIVRYRRSELDGYLDRLDRPVSPVPWPEPAARRRRRVASARYEAG